MERENPYVGFRPFFTRDALYFFGRDEQTRALLQRLHEFRFVSVVGNSGSGKSSLVLAGLMPALTGGFLSSALGEWVIVSMRPGDAPLENLAQALIEACGPAVAPMSRETLAASIRARGASAVTELLTQCAHGANVLLLADQFEELFAFMAAAGSEANDVPGRPPDHTVVEARIRRQADAQTFVSVLMAVADVPGAPAYVITTMRTDFLGDCDRFPGLPELINKAGYLVPRLTRDELRDVMEGPAKLAGVQITPRLRDLMLNEIGDKPDLLPLLQHALHRAWRTRARDKETGPLDLSHLERLGGLRQALSSEADALVADFDERMVAALFRRLTRVDGGKRRVRRPCALSELVAVTPAPREQIVALLERLSADGTNLLYRSRGTTDDDPRYDISHESLIRQWERLQRWMDTERDLARFYTALCEKAAHYRDTGELADATRAARRALQREMASGDVTEAWAARYASEMPATWAEVQRYLAQLRRQQRTRVAGWSFATALLLLLVAGFTWRQRQDRAWSEQQAELASLERLAETDPTQAVWLASQWSEDRYNDPQAMAALDHLEQRYTAAAEFTNVAVFTPMDSGRRVALITLDGRVRIVASNGVDTTGVVLERPGHFALDALPLADHTALVAMDNGEILHWHHDVPQPYAHAVDTIRGLRDMTVLGNGTRVMLESTTGRGTLFTTGVREGVRELPRAIDLLAASPTDTSLLALYERAPTSPGGAVVQYDIDADRVVSRWRVADSSSTTVRAAYAADGGTLLVASEMGHALELIDRRSVQRARLLSAANVRRITAAGPGATFLVADYDGDVRVVSTAADEAVSSLTRHDGAAMAMRVPHAPWVLSSDDDGDVRVTWIGRGTTPDATSGYGIPLGGHSRAAGMLNISATPQMLFTLDGDGQLRTWSVAALAAFEPSGIDPADDAFRVMARVAGTSLRPNGDDPRLQLNGRVLQAPGDSNALLLPLAVSNDGHTAAACAGRDRCWLFTAKTASSGAMPIQLPSIAPSDVALFLADGTRLMVQRGRDSLFEVQAATGTVLHRYAIDRGALWTVSRNGRVLVFRREHVMQAVRLDDPARTARVIDSSRVSVWRWSPAGARLAVVAGDTLRLFAFADTGGMTRRTLTFAATDSLLEYQIDAGGEWFAVLRGDRAIAVYRVGAGDSLVQQLRLPRPRGRLTSLRFLPWGHGLLANTADGNAELWQWRERRTFEDSLGRPSWSAWARRGNATSANGEFVLVRRTLEHHPSVSAAYEDNAASLAIDADAQRVTLLVQPSWAPAKLSSWYLAGPERRARFVERAPRGMMAR
jgi:WD40 repeat protein